MNERRAQRTRLRNGEAGDIERCRQWVDVEVRYNDLDAQGHVNNAVFFTYFEQARVAFLAELRVRVLERLKQEGEGVGVFSSDTPPVWESEHAESNTALLEGERRDVRAGGQFASGGAVDVAGTPRIEAADIPYVIASASCVYAKPIVSLAPISIGVYCSEMSRVSFEVRYVVCDGGRQTIYATGTTLIVNVDAETGRPRMLPEWVRLALTG